MYDAMRTLKEGARQLYRLHRDLSAPTLSFQAWKDNVFARHTLGDESKVELWYLAEHFLLVWDDWHSLLKRFIRYFGEPERRFPASWESLDSECSTLAHRLLFDRQLDHLVSAYWKSTKPNRSGSKDARSEVHDLYHAVVQNHRRWSLIRSAEAQKPSPMTDTRGDVPDRETWPRCANLIPNLNMIIWERCHQLPRRLAEALSFHLRQYAHTNLLLPWLVNSTGYRENSLSYPRTTGAPNEESTSKDDVQVSFEWDKTVLELGYHSALLKLLVSEKIVMPPINHYLALLHEPDLRDRVARVLNRIVEAIGAIGYDDFVKDIVHLQYNAGDDSLIGASEVNSIPGPDHEYYHSILLAVSKRNKKNFEFSSVLRRVREYLIRGVDFRAVIVLCDHWLPNMLDGHIAALRTDHDRGVRFLFLMVGTPGRIVSPVGVDLGLAP